MKKHSLCILLSLMTAAYTSPISTTLNKADENMAQVQYVESTMEVSKGQKQ